MMKRSIFIKGACELEHFSFLYKYGFRKFLISNNPDDLDFVSMKTLSNLVSNFKAMSFILTEVPTNKNVFDYYHKFFLENNGIYCYLEEIFHDQIGNSIIDITQFMFDYRLLDKGSLHNYLTSENY